MTSTSEISSFRMAPPPAAFYEQEGPMSQSNYAALLKTLCIAHVFAALPLRHRPLYSGFQSEWPATDGEPATSLADIRASAGRGRMGVLGVSVEID
ncbi:MAG: hypothetical protein ABSG32_32385, partial [Terriglobia bacterium]